jgi:hypothetical protein
MHFCDRYLTVAGLSAILSVALNIFGALRLKGEHIYDASWMPHKGHTHYSFHCRGNQFLRL